MIWSPRIAILPGSNVGTPVGVGDGLAVGDPFGVRGRGEPVGRVRKTGPLAVASGEGVGIGSGVAGVAVGKGVTYKWPPPGCPGANVTVGTGEGDGDATSGVGNACASCFVPHGRLRIESACSVCGSLADEVCAFAKRFPPTARTHRRAPAERSARGRILLSVHSSRASRDRPTRK